jgi:hypothetical protein
MPVLDFSTQQEFRSTTPRLGRRNVKGWIVNLFTDEQYTFQFDPEEVNIAGGASYANHNILGHSHQRDQYNYTKSILVNFILRANELLRQKDVSSQKNINDYHNFLWSLIYPQIEGPPPIILLVMPGILRMRAKLTDIGEDVKRWAADGSKMMAFDMNVKFREEASARITSDEVRTRGLFRGTNIRAVSNNLRHGFSPTGRKEER